MNVETKRGPRKLFRRYWSAVLLLTFVSMGDVSARAQDPAKTTKADAAVVGDTDAPAVTVPAAATPEERERVAWKMLADAMADAKHPQTRIQGLAALGLLRNSNSEKMIVDGMADPDPDVRTAAVLAAGQAKDHNLTTDVRRLLDDKEPQVAFAAAMTLWKMGDKSGEDILMSVVDGERSAGPTMMKGARHKISKDLHDPAMLARVGAMQGAAMMLGPFGYGITAYEYVHQSGGDLARASAIEQISQEKTEPIHNELVAALKDKDQTVRAASAKALTNYHDEATSMAVYALLADPKPPVRLTAAAAYLRTTGTPGPEPPTANAGPAPRKGKRLNTPSSTKMPAIPK
ncbi:MAG: HEAT repeat domain-containing protein [Acidobacteriota bacterium]|nr:HEAT repeat domain-containing protein [Acidobacteriota bacterium]